MVIRPLIIEDLETVVALEAAPPPPWSEGVFRDELAAENRIYLAADEDGVVVGFAGAMLVADEAHVTNLLVDPSWRRKGIGYELMKTLIEAAVEAGARHLTWRCDRPTRRPVPVCPSRAGSGGDSERAITATTTP